MKKSLVIALMVCLLATGKAAAEVLVLVHGYLGSAHSWVESGVLQRLLVRGYQHQGSYGHGPLGVHYQGSPLATERPIFTVDLPSQAPIAVQADWLAAYLADIRRRQPGQPIVMIAHSAGGVVARMTLVRHGGQDVAHLITIAAPHLGTGRAIQALDAADDSGPFGFVKNWLVRQATGDALYATFKLSRGVLIDLTPPAPGNLLFWLNQQPHPPITYTSVVRVGGFVSPGDPVVPPVSQDLNRVPALFGRATTYTIAQGHMLSPLDGELIGKLLAVARPGA